MRIFSLVQIAIAATISTIPAIGAEPPPAPTGLESFVAKPTVVLDLAEEVGTLHSTDATVAVAAVIATDTARPGEQMKGARFSLENNVGADFVYLEETELNALLGDLADIQGGMPGLKAPSETPWPAAGCRMSPAASSVRVTAPARKGRDSDSRLTAATTATHSRIAGLPRSRRC